MKYLLLTIMAYMAMLGVVIGLANNAPLMALISLILLGILWVIGGEDEIS